MVADWLRIVRPSARTIAFVLAPALLAVAPGGRARAQATPPLPPVPAISAPPIQHILPETTPNLNAGLPNFRNLPAGHAVPAVSVRVGAVGVVGATAFPAATLAGLTQGLTGPDVPLARIDAARRAILDLYRGHGYVLSTVSADLSGAGQLRFIVTEGRIVSVKLSKDIGPAGSMVLAFLNHLTEMRPVSEQALEHWVLLAQQIPGISVHAVLQADQGDPGALTLVAEVDHKIASGLITADNRGFEGTGPAEGLAVADLNSVTSHGDQTEVSLYHTSGGTNNFGEAAESFFIGSDGLRLRLYGGAGRAQPSGSLRSIDYRSALTVFGGSLTYPLYLVRNQSLDAALKFDGVENEIDTSAGRASLDSLRVARGDIDYALDDGLAGASRRAFSLIDVQLSKGLPAFGASPDGQIAGVVGRAGERTDFWKVTASIERTQALFSPRPGSTVALMLAAGGQYSPDVLPTEEEFYLGGSRYTRGYYSGQVTGDKALYATAELQLNTGLTLPLFGNNYDVGAQFYTFYDWGETWQNLSTDLNHRLASFGGGVRVALTRYLETDFEVTHRFVTQLEPAAISGTPPLHSTAIYWGVTAHY